MRKRTGALHVSYQKATPIDPPGSLRARTQEMTPKKTILCVLTRA